MVVSLPKINVLTKIHKPSWGIRPVVPCHSVVQGPCSEVLSIILKTLLGDFPQILTSTKELVHNFETALKPKLRSMLHGQWKDRIFICTADIEGFYTNVPIKLCREKLGELVRQKYGRNREGKVKSDYVMNLFDIQQNNLLMKAQVNGECHLALPKNRLPLVIPPS